MASAVPEDLRAKFVAAGQGHVFGFVDSGVATPAEAAALVAQLQAIDVGLVNELYAATTDAAAVVPGSDGALEPPSGVTVLSSSSAADVATWTNAGLAAVAAGKAGVLILAGGQGTRLGFDRPKGEYNIGLPSQKSLFQLQVERVQRVKALAAAHAGVPVESVSLPLYIMTSPMTDGDTRAYFASHSNFGFRDVRFFSQGTLPCLTPEGKILLETAGRVAEAPDGNGGIYRALHTQGIVADMQARGVVGVHVFAVDNAIVRAADPAFIGYCIGRGADVGSKACPKAGPHEKVGVLCKRGGRYSVVEYSEMDRAAAEARDAATGELTYNAGNICIHWYSTEFLATECSPAKLPKVYHLARKAIPCADPATGRTAKPAATNGIKLESFIFDVFPQAEAMAVLQISRADEFSPVKNAPGAPDDSPVTARAMVLDAHRRWLTAAGAIVEGDAVVEISPGVSYGGEGLGSLAGRTFAAGTSTIVAAAEEDAGAVAPGTTVVRV